MSDQNEQLRAEFETWAELTATQAHGVDHDVTGWYYFDELTSDRWEAWQAARASAPAPQAAPSGQETRSFVLHEAVQECRVLVAHVDKRRPDSDEWESYNNGISECIEALENMLRAAPLTQAAPRGYVICINGEADYDRLVEVGNFLCDIVKDDEQHPLFSLFDDVMDAIKTWEDVHVDLDDLSTESVIADRASTCADIASMTQVNDGMTRKEISETVKGVFRGGALVSGEKHQLERARFEQWVKEDRIPPGRRDAHWKTWQRAIYGVDQSPRRAQQFIAPKQPE